MAITKKKTNKMGIPLINNTARQDSSYLYVTGAGDDLVNGVVGDGEKMLLQNASSGEVSAQTGFIEDIWLKDGYLFWSNAIIGDEVNLEIILPANTFFVNPKGQGNYDLVNGAPSPNVANTGLYMMYPIDITLNRFVNRLDLVGTNDIGMAIESNDTAYVPTQLKFRFTATSDTKNPNLTVRFAMEIYRQTTV